MNEPATRTDVLVLMGGPDAERAVSVQSGREVAQALREAGRFNVIEAVIERPTTEELARLGGEVVFPVLHGSWGEGGPLQTQLEALGLPYVGSGPAAAAQAMDKLHTKALLEPTGVRSPAACELGEGEDCSIAPPLVLKPVDDGSSVDIRICHDADDVAAARAHLHPRRARLMAEAYIPGRELTVGIVDGTLLPIVEIEPKVSFYDYEAKYDRDDTRYIVAPTLPAVVERECNEFSRTAWEVLGCRDIARVDFRLDSDGHVWFLEINTMPGFTTHSLVPLAARAAGLDMPKLCAMLVNAALARHGTAAPVATP